MQWIPCSVIKCRRIHALWCNGSRLYAVESMQRGPMHPDRMQWILCSMAQSIPMECSGFHAARLNAVYSMQRGKMRPDSVQRIPCSEIECSGFHAACLKQWMLCSMAQSIPIECSGFHALWRNGSRLYAVESMQRGPKHSD